MTKDWKQDGKFNLIVIAHRSNCSCNCIYCNFSKDKNYWNNRESYNIVPVLEDLRDRNLLAENLMISICGGECTEYPNNEFENIMEFIIKQKCKLWINSSGFNYSPLISKCLSLSLLDITISVDAGTKEVYEKIKRVKKFDDVWNNIAEYQRNAVLDAGGYYGRMTVKFVIVPGINNTQKHLYDFIKKCREAKIKYIRIAVEYNWWTENKHKEMPKNLIKLVKYIQKFNQEFSIEPVEFAIRLFQIADSK